MFAIAQIGERFSEDGAAQLVGQLGDGAGKFRVVIELTANNEARSAGNGRAEFLNCPGSRSLRWGIDTDSCGVGASWNINKGQQRFAKRLVDMDRAGVRPGGLLAGPSSKAVKVGGVEGWIGCAKRMAGADMATKQIDLLYGLIGAAILQFGWAVGGDQDQGNAALAGFNHRWQPVGGCRT